MFCVLALVITTVFIPVDYVFSDNFRTFLILRIVHNSAFAFVYWKTSLRAPIPSAMVLHLVVGSGIIAMIAAGGGITSLYASGLVVIFCAHPVLAPLSVGQTCAVVAPTLTVFLGLPFFTGGVDFQTYFIHTMFPVAGAMVAIGSTSVLDQIRFAEFTERMELKEARDHLSQMDAVKSRFTANVHHELRTPLTLLLAPLETLLAGELGALSEKAIAHLRMMRNNGLRLLRLINNLLDLAKVENQRMTLQRRPLRLGSLVEGVVETSTGMANRKGLELSVSVSPDLIEINADRDALEKVLVNLVGNALKFTDKGGWIRIDAANDGDGVTITVADSGIGIPQDQLNRVFDRFAQVDMSATRRHEGTGIGLSLVKELVDLHGGTVWAESDGAGLGTRMIVHLPVGEEDPGEHDDDAAQTVPLEYRSAPMLAADGIAELEGTVSRWEMNQLKESAPETSPSDPAASEILIVEDNGDMRAFLKSLLSHEFRVRTAANGREGLEQVMLKAPDVVLTDVMMPEMTGIELCAALKRQEPRIRSIPVIMVTSKAEREMRVEGLEQGADDYITKPFHPRELLARVRSFARLRRLQDTLESNNKDLQSALDRLKHTQAQLVHQEKMSSLGQLVAGVAHEINNPVHFIQGNLPFLEEYIGQLVTRLAQYEQRSVSHQSPSSESLKADIDSVLDGIREGVRRTSGIVQDLRVFSRLDQADVKEVDIEESLESTLNLLRGRLKQIEVRREYGATPRITCLAGQLSQVFMNLLTNAADAVEVGGRIVIRTGAHSEGWVFIEIEDNGCGMSADVLEHIFEPFFTTKDVGKGTGLGLSISYGVVERHSGKLLAFSGPDGGARFRVELPIEFPTDAVSSGN